MSRPIIGITWTDKVLPKDEVYNLTTIMALATLYVPASFGISLRTLPGNPGSVTACTSGRRRSSEIRSLSSYLRTRFNAQAHPLGQLHSCRASRHSALTPSNGVDAMQPAFLKIGSGNDRVYMADDPSGIY